MFECIWYVSSFWASFPDKPLLTDSISGTQTSGRIIFKKPADGWEGSKHQHAVIVYNPEHFVRGHVNVHKFGEWFLNTAVSCMEVGSTCKCQKATQSISLAACHGRYFLMFWKALMLSNPTTLRAEGDCFSVSMIISFKWKKWPHLTQMKSLWRLGRNLAKRANLLNVIHGGYKRHFVDFFFWQTRFWPDWIRRSLWIFKNYHRKTISTTTVV